MSDKSIVPDWAPTSQDLKQTLPERSRMGYVRLYDRGGSLEAPSGMRTSTSGNTGVKRGVITGWTRASRKRMREFMLTHHSPRGWSEYCVTLTVPGSPLTPEEKRRVWNLMTWKCRHAGIGAVWRLEVQKRGAAHWHLLVSCPPLHEWISGYAEDSGTATMGIIRMWQECVDSLGETEWTVKSGNKYRCLRSMLPGAREHMVDVQPMGNQSAGWLRYMFDHASKAKQEQEAATGRHWGIVNRSVFVAASSSVVAFTEEDFSRLHRVLRRWNRPRVRLPDRLFASKDLKDPWQTKLGYAPKRGLKGRSVWFCAPEFMQKLCAWISSTSLQSPGSRAVSS